MRKIIFLGCFITLIGCLHEIRRFTYPPEFTYVENKELDSSMHKLANLVAGLNQSLTIGDAISEEAKQKQVVGILKQMEVVGSTLNPGTMTNHPQIDRNIHIFRTSLERARMAAENNPPNYYLAGTITGNCNNCHSMR